MPSPRTDPPASSPSRSTPDWSTFDPRGLAALAGRLNVRLVFATSLVALVGLLTSGIAIQQILPGFFVAQTEQRIRDAAASTGFSLQEAITRIGADPQSEPTAQIRELRDSRIAPAVATQAADFFNATVTIINDVGATVVRVEPPDTDALRESGLRRDTELGPTVVPVEIELPNGERVIYQVVVSDLYSTREATLEQIRSALIGAGLLALGASLVT